jgi:hypothetical protein|tara:strand:+ start:2950 stop:3252 length:303 start_codon:yes stop_codon:yes gene_type:complete
MKNLTQKQIRKELARQLELTYVHEFNSVYELDGELTLAFDNYILNEEGKYVKIQRFFIINAETMMNFLPALIDASISADKFNRKLLREEIIESVQKLSNE